MSFVWAFVLYPDLPMCVWMFSAPGQAAKPGPLLHVQFRSFYVKILIWKSKHGVYARVNKHLRATVCSSGYWDTAVWHLAFPQASNRDSACSLCPWNTLFICRCLLYASLPFTKLLPSQGNDSKHGLFALKSNTVFNNFAVWIKHKHVPADTSKVCLLLVWDTEVQVDAICRAVGCILLFQFGFIWQDHPKPNVETSNEKLHKTQIKLCHAYFCWLYKRTFNLPSDWQHFKFASSAAHWIKDVTYVEEHNQDSWHV